MGHVMWCGKQNRGDKLGGVWTPPGKASYRRTGPRFGQLVAFSGELSWALVRLVCTLVLRFKISKMHMLIIL